MENTRITEIESRLSAIKEEAMAEDANLDALLEEQKALSEERAAIIEKAEERKAIIDAVEAEGITARTFENEGETKMEKRITIDSAEYRNLWLKNLQGRLDEEETRAYASTDANNAIPTLVADTFFEKMKKLAPMLSEITLMRVAGNIKFITEGVRDAVSVHTQNATVNAANDTMVTVQLGAQEFVKIIQISRSAAEMSAPVFEAWLVEMLAGDIARAIDNYILNNSTNGVGAMTFTTGTNQILNTTGNYTYKNITDLCALLPAAYDAEAKFVVNKATLYNKIANIVNSAGNPIFVNNTEEGMTGRLLGYPVVVDDYVTTANNALYLARWKGVVGNLSQDIQVDRNDSAGFTSNSVMFRGSATFDSKPAQVDAIVRMVSTTA